MEEKTMRILMIGPFPPPIHGMSLANRMLRDGLVERGHQVETLNTHTGTSFGNLKSQGRFTREKLVGSVSQILKGIVRILFGPRLDVVYITPAQSEWGYLKYTPFIFSSAIRGSRSFIHIHGGYFRTMVDASKGWKRGLIKMSLDRISGAIVLGLSLRYMFEGIVPGEKISVCPNAVEDEIFATKEEIEEKISCWEKDDTIRLVYLSNLMRTKGILDLLEAVKLLKDSGVPVHLDLAGSIEPEVGPEIRRYQDELGEAVTYHGVVKGLDKKRLLLKNYVFALPTYYPNEGQPISILEALATGSSLCVTNHGGIRDIISNGTGSFVEPKSPQSIASIAQRLFKKGPQEVHSDEVSLYREKVFVGRILQIFENKI